MDPLRNFIDSLRQYDPRQAENERTVAATNAIQQEQSRANRSLEDNLLTQALMRRLNEFNLQRAQQAAPLQDFTANVGALGPTVGANTSVSQNPEWAQKTFGPSSVPMESAIGTLPDVAQSAAGKFYNWGPEMARQLNYLGESFPIQRELMNMQQQNALQQIGEHGKWSVKAAEAGRAGTSDEHAKARAQQASSGAMGLLSSAPVMSSVNALMEAAPQVKDAGTARTLIGQIGALRNQLDSTANMATSVGVALGAGPELPVIVQSTVNNVKEQLRKAHEELYNKYWGPKAEKKATLGSVVESLGPSTGTEGYMP